VTGKPRTTGRAGTQCSAVTAPRYKESKWHATGGRLCKALLLGLHDIWSAVNPAPCLPLSLQLANCYGQGLDKAPLSIRLQFGEGCLARCLATSSDPLSGEGAWWQAGEDPWRLLATALEVAAAVTSGDPTTFVSHLPVHQVGQGGISAAQK
jgi:DNA-directed RNA polymerase